jgi:hypothetical protein
MIDFRSSVEHSSLRLHNLAQKIAQNFSHDITRNFKVDLWVPKEIVKVLLLILDKKFL